ncbi:hypothetical protein [Fulvivirga lutimaris]|uniref:hypothetical protein n=1 Tax=Fulvivirga lutimaris TaxID=1819566 RepID=UPI0012BBD007|nr:hypothetical protein [Fulvivirga lutimaris]MTI40040.1 hypothetical protein [Fulvivirga lutimaris]
MKFIIIPLIALILTSCSKPINSKTKGLISGTWNHLGFFIDGNLEYDTLSQGIKNDFELDMHTIEYIIQTDSGKFVHIYSQIDSQLIRINNYNKLDINKLTFTDGFNGKLFSYSIDSSKLKTLEIQDDFEELNFKLISSGNEEFIEIEYPGGLKMKSLILELTSKSMLLQFDSLRTSKFDKITLP